jgi:hypothetical protein
VAWRRFSRSHHGAAAVRDFEAVRGQLLLVLSVATGFLVGAAMGAIAFAVSGLRGAPLAVGIVTALAVWTFYRERMA